MLPREAVVLVLAPHPDDEVFGCGGTISLHADNSGRVQIILLTSGQEGGNPDARVLESVAAAKVMGVPPPICWQYRDRQLQYGERLVEQILSAIYQFGATVLFAPSLWEVHPDHRATALSAFEALRRHGGCDLMAYEVGAMLRPNIFIDITETLAKKRRAMACFKTQLERQRYDLQIEGLSRYRTYTLPKNVEAAEAFEYIPAKRIKKLALEFFRSEYLRQSERGLIHAPEDMPTVNIIVRCFEETDGLDITLNSIALQTWGRIEVIVVIDANFAIESVPIAHELWCGRFPMRTAQKKEIPDVWRHTFQKNFVICLDAGDYIPPDLVSEAVKLATKKPLNFVGILLHNLKRLDELPEKADIDRRQKWREELAILLDFQAEVVAIYLAEKLTARDFSVVACGSKHSDRKIWLKKFALNLISFEYRQFSMMHSACFESAKRYDSVDASCFIEFFNELSDDARQSIIDATREGLFVPRIISTLDLYGITGFSLVDRVRTSARYASERNYIMRQLDLVGIGEKGLEESVKLFANAYKDMEFVRHTLSELGNITGEDWRNRLLQVCQESRQFHELKRDLNAMRMSRSWKITRPLRALGSLYRRFRKIK